MELRPAEVTRECAPGSRQPPLSGSPALDSPHRPCCQSPLALTASRLGRPGVGLMQSARYLGRRLHYQPGPCPARPQPASQPEPRQTARACSAPPAAPERHAAVLCPLPGAGPVAALLGLAGRTHPGFPGCQTCECALCAGPGWVCRGGPSRAVRTLESRSLKCTSVACPPRLPPGATGGD